MLQLVLGRAGCGKTEYVFRNIHTLIDSGEKNVLLLTPEQFSFEAERRLLSELKESRVNLVESTTFSRLAAEISRVYGGDRLPVLTKGARAVMMKRALETVQDGLCLFENSVNNSSFITSMLKIYDEMKSCRVDTEDILAAADNTDKELLQKKLRDIAVVIDAYDALIADEYYDSENELTRLYEKLLHLDYFKDRTVFIDGFSGFVAQEYKIIEVMINQAKEVYITFCTDSYVGGDKYDLFSYVNANIDILRGVTRKAGEKFLPPILLEKNYRAKNQELLLAERYCFSAVVKPYEEKPQNVSLYCAGSLLG